MKEKIIIEQDDREGDFQIMSDIQKLNLEFDKKRLKIGDYIYNNLLIERKEISDFCSSILDKRLENQIKNMNESGKDCFVIIVGNIKDRKLNIHENCILGKICSLVYKHKIKVIQVEDEFQFLWVMRNLIEKYKENEN